MECVSTRRSFLSDVLCLGGMVSVSGMPLFAADDRQQWYEKDVSGAALLDMPIMEGFKPTMVEIKVGATKPFEMLHISDSHLVMLDAADLAKSDKKDLAFFRARLKAFKHPTNVEMFAAALAYAKAKGLPVLHTGDLLDIVSEGALASVRRNMEGRDWFYAIGNHEYCSGPKRGPKKEWLKDARRRMKESFPNEISCAARVVNGVNFVSFDNVGMSHDVFDTQFAFIKKEFAKGLPTVLAFHIPFWTPDLADRNVEEAKNNWARDILKSKDDLNSAWLAACPGKGDLPINKTLVEWLPRQKNLKAMLCGHKHFEYRTQFCENVMQYVCGATYNGNAYHIRFL